MLNIMPKTTSGKKWLKRIVFGEMVKMPAEIGPPISPVRSSGPTGQAPISRNEQRKENNNDLCRGRYEEPAKIPASRADREHKVIYCVATLE